MTVADEYVNQEIGHQVDLIWHQNYVIRQISHLLEAENLAMKVRMFSFFESGARGIEAFLSREKRENERLVAAIQEALFPYINDLIQQERRNELIMLAALFGGEIDITSATIAGDLEPMGLKAGEMLKSFGDQRLGFIAGSIRMAISQGDGFKVVRSTLFGRGGLNARSLNSLRVTIRTAMTAAASLAKESIARANPRLIRALRYTAVLDSRTTAICRSLDGNVYSVGVGPRPPQHWGCRSFMLYVFVHYSKLGMRNPPQFIKNIFTGEPPDRPTYTQWLRKQSESVQNDVLGKRRAELFRGDASIEMRSFTNREGRLLTLEELSARRTK